MLATQAASRSKRSVGGAMGGRVNDQSTVAAVERAWRLGIIATSPGTPIPLLERKGAGASQERSAQVAGEQGG